MIDIGTHLWNEENLVEKKDKSCPYERKSIVIRSEGLSVKKITKLLYNIKVTFKIVSS